MAAPATKRERSAEDSPFPAKGNWRTCKRTFATVFKAWDVLLASSAQEPAAYAEAFQKLGVASREDLDAKALEIFRATPAKRKEQGITKAAHVLANACVFATWYDDLQSWFEHAAEKQEEHNEEEADEPDDESDLYALFNELDQSGFGFDAEAVSDAIDAFFEEEAGKGTAAEGLKEALEHVTSLEV